MNISEVMLTATFYVLRKFILEYGRTEDVGLFHAYFVILNSYVSLVFLAMNTDYYPRPAAVNNDNVLWS